MRKGRSLGIGAFLAEAGLGVNALDDEERDLGRLWLNLAEIFSLEVVLPVSVVQSLDARLRIGRDDQIACIGLA